jgi:hypothetical protein
MRRQGFLLLRDLDCIRHLMVRRGDGGEHMLPSIEIGAVIFLPLLARVQVGAYVLVAVRKTLPPRVGGGSVRDGGGGLRDGA